nr:conjugal transfer protein TraS [Pseudomonadota bacterium]
HVHLAVRAERMDGYRLNPRKADLQRWRERFAARLQDRGINAVATRASARGLAPAPKQLWRIRAADESRERQPRANSRTADAVKQARGRAIEAWGHLANTLAASPEGQDQLLALEVVRYVGQQFGKTGQSQVLREELSRRGVGGIDPPDPTRQNPERKMPRRGR